MTLTAHRLYNAISFADLTLKNFISEIKFDKISCLPFSIYAFVYLHPLIFCIPLFVKSAGGSGRPQVLIQREQLTLLQDAGFTAVQMARRLGCSTSLVYKRLAEENLHMRHRYAHLNDAELISIFLSCIRNIPMLEMRHADLIVLPYVMFA